MGEDGSFSAVLTSPQKNGELLNVTLTDKAGNVSLAAPVTAGDTTSPDAPTNLAVSQEAQQLQKISDSLRDQPVVDFVAEIGRAHV